MYTSKLPLAFRVPDGGKSRYCSELPPLQVLLAKARMLSLSSLPLSSSGILKLSSNTLHITMSEFSLEAIFAM